MNELNGKCSKFQTGTCIQQESHQFMSTTAVCQHIGSWPDDRPNNIVDFTKWCTEYQITEHRLCDTTGTKIIALRRTIAGTSDHNTTVTFKMCKKIFISAAQQTYAPPHSTGFQRATACWERKKVRKNKKRGGEGPDTSIAII